MKGSSPLYNPRTSPFTIEGDILTVQGHLPTIEGTSYTFGPELEGTSCMRAGVRGAFAIRARRASAASRGGDIDIDVDVDR